MGIEAYSAFLNTKEILHKFQPVEQIILFFYFFKFLFFYFFKNRKQRISRPKNMRG